MGAWVTGQEAMDRSLNELIPDRYSKKHFTMRVVKIQAQERGGGVGLDWLKIVCV